MDGTRKFHPERGNSEPKGSAGYVLTNKWILAKTKQNKRKRKTKTKNTKTKSSQKPQNKKTKKQTYRILKIQFTQLKYFKKLKCPSEYTSVPLGRNNKAITSGKAGRTLGGKVDGGGVGREWGT